jgi:predicted Zn-dependent protease
MTYKISALLLLAVPLLATSCESPPNIFTIDDDIELGGQLRDEIAAHPEEYPLLDRAEYPVAYAHLERIRDEILSSDDVQYRDEFTWELHIVNDDEMLNAFAAPGGYIYVYTGLIKFLDREDDLAGVLGHEIAHADQRHSTNQLTKAYGLDTLLGLLLGDDRGTISDIAQGLTTLQFSRADETESDEFSVQYLCDTHYAANGAASFFEKLDGASVPAFLSTHPNPDNRVQAINDLADELGCDTTPWTGGQYADLVGSLP